jgi:Lrp/AsnC family leucine-responsive transcriptional regulator
MLDDSDEKLLKGLDPTDWKILKELQKDASITDVELGHRVNHSSPGERKHRLEKLNVITGYYAEIDMTKVGLSVTAFIHMKLSDKDTGSEILKVVEESNEIIECHKCAGDFSFIMKVVASSNEQVREIVEKLTPYGMTTTSFVFVSSVRRPVLEPNKSN